MTTTKEKSGMLIIHGGHLGGSTRTKDVQNNEEDLEPLFPRDVNQEDQEECQEEEFEPLLPVGVGVETEN